MANRLYDKGREGYLGGDLSWRDDDIRAFLIDLADYAPNFVTDQFVADIPAAARVAMSAALTGKSITAGVADAAPGQFTAVAGDPSEVLVLAHWTGSAATSRIVAYIDTAVGLAYSPNGADLTVNWDTGSNKIFKL